MTEVQKPAMLEGAELRVNEDYDCNASGHIMGEWMVKKGVGPGGPPTKYRTCVVPGCAPRGYQLVEALVAPSGA